MGLPAPYDNLPLPLQNTLIQSQIEAEKGWPGLSLADYLKMRNDDGAGRNDQKDQGSSPGSIDKRSHPTTQ